MRKGRLDDRLPVPYKNTKAAAAANGGAIPPDLSHITRHKRGRGGVDYIFALMTGYVDPPAGFKVPDGLYYNVYFHPGKLIAMPPPLYNGVSLYFPYHPANFLTTFNIFRL